MRASRPQGHGPVRAYDWIAHHAANRPGKEAVRELALEHQASPCGAQVTISVGVACVRPADGQPLEHAQTTLFQQADAALYRAKQAGRDRVALYGTDVQAEPPPEAAQHG